MRSTSAENVGRRSATEGIKLTGGLLRGRSTTATRAHGHGKRVVRVTATALAPAPTTAAIKRRGSILEAAS